MTYIINFIKWFAENIWWPLQQTIKVVIFAIGQFLAILLDGFLTVVLAVLSTLDVGTIATNAASSWGLLDSSVAWILVNSGVTTGLTIIGASFLVRFLLNLIPAAFTRI